MDKLREKMYEYVHAERLLLELEATGVCTFLHAQTRYIIKYILIISNLHKINIISYLSYLTGHMYEKLCAYT